MKHFYLKFFSLSLFLFAPHFLSATLEEDFLDAITNDNVKRIQELQGQGADVCGVYNGMAPLHAAAAAGANGIITYLLAQGVPVDVKGSCNKTALHWAIQNDKKETVALLLERGANSFTFAWADDQNGMNPLMYAVNYAGSGIVKLLLAKGAHISAINAKGQNAFDIAYALRKGRICAIFGNSKEMRNSIQRAMEKIQSKS